MKQLMTLPLFMALMDSLTALGRLTYAMIVLAQLADKSAFQLQAVSILIQLTFAHDKINTKIQNY